MRKFVTFCLSLLLLVSLAVPAAASEYVIDDAGLLTPEQRSALNDYAEAIAGEFGVAVYMMTVDDYSDYGHDPNKTLTILNPETTSTNFDARPHGFRMFDVADEYDYSYKFVNVSS